LLLACSALACARALGYCWRESASIAWYASGTVRLCLFIILLGGFTFLLRMASTKCPSKFVAGIGRVAVTLAAVAAALATGWRLCSTTKSNPGPADGRIKANVVRLARMSQAR